MFKNRQDLALGTKTVVITLLGNLFLCIIKIIGGGITHSQALIADGLHSLSDLLSDILVGLAFILGRKPRDANHPYGHGKIETLLAWLLGLTLVFIGISLIYKNLTKLSAPHSIYGLGAFIIASFSYLAKEGLYRYNLKVGRQTHSQALIANALHHRSDAFSSLAVLIGILLTYMGWEIFDLIASLIVSMFIGGMGIKIIYTSGKELIETSLSSEILNKVEEAALKVKKVRSCHQVIGRNVGNNMVIELHIVVDPKITVDAAHEVSRNVENQIRSIFSNAHNITVHIDPYDDEKEDLTT
ncbi:MAG: cation diffusion facilitator family transporter [Chlamydiota bacterium]